MSIPAIRIIIAALALTLALVANAPVKAAGDACEAPPVPAVSIILYEKPVAYNTSVSKDDLTLIPVESIPYAAKDGVEINGVMRSGLAIDHVTRFHSEGRCVWIERIDVVLRAAPKVFIANEFRTDACRFREIFQHEQKHVAADHELLDRYTGRMHRVLEMAFAAPRDYTLAVASPHEMSAAQGQLEDGVRRVLEVLYDEMLVERSAEQQEVDSLDEYDRMNGAC